MLLLATLILLLLFPAPVLGATRTGVLAWADKVVPALFPFLILTSLMTYYQLPQMLGKVLNPFFRHVLKISPITFFIMFMSFIAGNPSGARVAKKYYDDGAITQKEFRGLLYYCNFASPLFIIGTIGALLYESPQVGYLLLFAHLVGSLAVFICCYPLLKTKDFNRAEAIHFPERPFSELLLEAIETAVHTLMKIGGIIVFFYIVTEALHLVRIYELLAIALAPLLGFLQIDNAGPLFSGMVEFTQGVFKINASYFPLNLQLALTAFIVSFAGLSVHTQVLLFSKGANFKYGAYLMFRSLHGWASALIVLFSWRFFLQDVSDVFLPLSRENGPAFSFLPFTLGIIGFYFLLRLYGFLPKLNPRYLLRVNDK